MAPGSFKLDTTTKWNGKYAGTRFRISATSSEDITTEVLPAGIEIRQANPGVNDGAYITTARDGVSRVGLASISCDNTRSLTFVDITDNTQLTYVARKIQNDVVLSYNALVTETGPASAENEAFVSVISAQRVDS